MTHQRITDEEMNRLRELDAEVDRCQKICDSGNDGFQMQVNYAEEALGRAMVENRKALLTYARPVVDYCTLVDSAALHAAIRVWMHTSIIRVYTVDGEKQDLYLKIIAMAILRPYDETVQRYQNGDEGLISARRKCKRIVFNHLALNPTSLLHFHDEVVVQADAAVESGHASQELEDHAAEPLHPPA